MKEYLNTETYEYKLAHTKPDGEWVEIPDGAVEARINGAGGINFINENEDYMNNTTGGEWVGTHRGKHDIAGHTVVWQRQTQPEALPFIDDNTQSINDQYAEIEQVRQAIKVKSGSNSDHALDAMSFGLMGFGAKDNVNHPSHYTSDPSGIECIEVTRHRNFNIGNAMKYLWRNGLKDSDAQIQDLKKAIWYIEDEIKRLEKQFILNL